MAAQPSDRPGRTRRAPSPEDFRQTLGRFATGVTVVTTVADSVPHGMTVNSFTSVSLDPLLVLVCVDRAASLNALVPQSEVFAVTLLAADQERESVRFSSPRPAGAGQFADLDWHPAPVTGAPLLARGLGYVDCRLHATYPGGDHDIFVGEVVDAATCRDADPLLFFAGVYRHLPSPSASR